MNIVKQGTENAYVAPAIHCSVCTTTKKGKIYTDTWERETLWKAKHENKVLGLSDLHQQKSYHTVAWKLNTKLST